MNNGKKYTFIASNINGDPVELSGYFCTHCKEPVPDVGDCKKCHTHYEHLETKDIFETGMVRYKYGCNCEENKKFVQKTIKLEKLIESDGGVRPSVAELIKGFM